ncbi:unnamed protein product [Mytilus coruscus]|uniref:Uncharacterized protein n=1 Tax=Mytilus coruscus TaxID=42192 RepID=A0A6J8E128_MYTCO|nr:unnamed protein product [Mytilus coruscus]
MLTYNRTFIRREDVFLLMLQESLILPSNQCIPGMWSTEQSVIITEHSNYYEQMTLVVKQIMESGPDAPKPSLPKRPKSKLDSLFTHAKKKKTFDPKELHDYLRFRCVDQCGINKQFIVEDMWKSGTLQKEELLDILKRATRQIQRCEAQMLLFYIKFGTFWNKSKLGTRMNTTKYNSRIMACLVKNKCMLFR